MNKHTKKLLCIIKKGVTSLQKSKGKMLPFEDNATDAITQSDNVFGMSFIKQDHS